MQFKLVGCSLVFQRFGGCTESCWGFFPPVAHYQKSSSLAQHFHVRAHAITEFPVEFVSELIGKSKELFSV